MCIPFKPNEVFDPNKYQSCSQAFLVGLPTVAATIKLRNIEGHTRDSFLQTYLDRNPHKIAEFKGVISQDTHSLYMLFHGVLVPKKSGSTSFFYK
jgi:hypothetical protein